MSDDLLKKPVKAQTPADNAGRTARAMEDRAVTESRELSDDERLEIVRHGFAQNKLPNLPTIPGYHTCWLSTNNPSDTISWRQQIGYELLKPADVPGWIHGNCSDERFQGFVGVNEMIGARIRIDLFNRIMDHMHHSEPQAMEAGIRSQIDSYASDAESSGGRIDVEEGMKELGKTVRAPTSW